MSVNLREELLKIDRQGKRKEVALNTDTSGKGGKKGSRISLSVPYFPFYP
jgi:hypothetical protein